MSKLEMTYRDDIAIVTINNPPVNALSLALRKDLIDTVDKLENEQGVRAVVLCSLGNTFIAGADISEFGEPPQPPMLPDVVLAIENASKPWIAAIGGDALGGGFEIVLGCHARIASSTARVGFPETRLGLIPGAGGTVRLARIAGVKAALDLTTSGQSISASQALALGMIDAVCDGNPLEQAFTAAVAFKSKEMPLAVSRMAAPSVEPEFWPSIEAEVRSRSKGESAPMKAIECVRKGIELSFEDALALERKTFLELRNSEQSRALRHVFFGEKEAARPPWLSSAVARQMSSVAIIGGGTMGVGITAAMRNAGFPVLLVERDQPSLKKALANVVQIFEGAAKRGRISNDAAQKAVAGVRGSNSYTDLSDADLVIEAVFEDLLVKHEVFEKLSEVCKKDAILATNTSYLDPAAISAKVASPQRFIGLHFFSPAHVMKLVEIVPAAATSNETIAVAFDVVKKLGKIPVRSGICDGFIGNRILKITREQAERVLLAGASPSDVDAAMRAFGMPMGPFEAQDLGGLDIAAYQRAAARGRGETPFAPLADRLCAMGRVGQKVKSGWYDYLTGDRIPRESSVVAAIVAEEAAKAAIARRSWTEPQIVDCIVTPMINEAANILDEGIALSPVDIDLVEIHGYGFPRWRGGLMHYAENAGLDTIAKRLASLHAAGLAKEPSHLLLRSAEKGRFNVHRR